MVQTGKVRHASQVKAIDERNLSTVNNTIDLEATVDNMSDLETTLNDMSALETTVNNKSDLNFHLPY